MVKVVLVAVNPAPVALMLYVVPALPTIWQPVKVAAPAAAVTGLGVQVRVAPAPGWVAMVRVIGFVAEVTVLPTESSMVTTGWAGAAQAAPLVPPPGWGVNASLV